jgi:signal transduction histidine kinase
MQKLTDKLLILCLCVLVLFFSEISPAAIPAILAAIAVSSLNSYFENVMPPVLCLASIAACFFMPEFVVFLPLIAYDCNGFEKWYFRFAWAAALPLCATGGITYITACVIVFCAAALLLHYRTSSWIKAQTRFFTHEDDAKEKSSFLESKNRELADKQDYEIRLATLTERNRIAREIHDNVGHLLTRSIFQISALNVKHTAEPDLLGELGLVKDTLTDAMDSIRSSVHGLHDESVDLELKLRTMAEEFKFCPVKLRYDAGKLPVDIKLCFIAVASEALNNAAKHSGASQVYISVTEHPAFCQLIISDNGNAKSRADSNGGTNGRVSGKLNAQNTGIGLINMAQRVEKLGGIFNAENKNGFKIFISVPLAKTYTEG